VFEQLNELDYRAKDNTQYRIYFLKFWHAEDDKDDYIVKYEISTSDSSFFWYGRISKKRLINDIELTLNELKRPSDEVFTKIEKHLKALFIYVMKKALDKGHTEPNTEFVFYVKPLITMRVWQG
jgi:hypothetical protein